MAEVKQDILYNFICNVGAFAEGMDRAIHGLDDLDRGMRNVEKQTSFVNQTLAVFVANLGVKVVEAATRAFGILKSGFDQFVNIAKDATMQAARIEVQWRTLSLTAGNAGQSIEDMTKHIQALRAAGIKTGEAIEIVTQFLANELPVKNITELARRAQDMAVVIGRDSTEAFQRFNWFLQTGNSEWIRTMGITKTATQMIQEYAQAQGLAVKALSDRQRKEALVQGLMKETLRYEGAYEEAMRDPYKRWTSLPRLISNVTEVLGAVFVPMMGTVVDVFSDALEKIERLFRVTKQEAKETGATIGEWKEGFLKLRAVVTAFANWFMSIWKRVTGGFNEAAEGMMDRFVNAIVNGVKAAADALRRFAQFVASIFGGRAPGEVTAEAIARTKPEARPEPAKRVAPAAGPPVEVPVTPGAAEKVRAKPVAPPAVEDLQQMSILTGAWAEATKKLATASAAAAKAREALARAEDWLERASEKVYDIRRKIQRLELDWAEIPERFIRGRKRQLQLELMAAEHEEHERQKVVEAERERLQLAEEIERQAQQAADNVKRQMDKLADSIKQQAEKYEEWLGKLHEAEEVRLVEPVQAIVNEFESLDDLTAVYLEEIEGQLMPAFASIEESVLAIVDNLGVAWDKAKGLGASAWEWGGKMLAKLREVKDWFDGLPDWVKDLLKGLGIAVALNFITKGAVGTVLQGLLKAAFMAAGIGPTGFVIAGGIAALYIAIKPFLDPRVQEDWKKAFRAVTTLETDPIAAIGQAAETTLEKTPIIGTLLEWIDSLGKAKPKMEKAADETLAQPLIDAMDRADRRILRESILPEMVNDILDWLQRLSVDAVPPLEDFTRVAVDAFQKVADGGVNLTGVIDTLTGRVRILDAAMRGFAPPPAAMALMAEGTFKVITLNQDFSGATFGHGSEDEIRDVVWDTVRDAWRH